MKKVKILSFLLSVILIFSVLAGCGQSNNQVSGNDDGDSLTQDDKDSSTQDDTVEEDQEIDNFNESGYPIVDEKITLTMMGADTPDPRRNWEENKFFKIMEDMTNIHFEFVQVSTDNYTEKKNLAFASEDLPDVFFKGALSAQDEMSYGGQGILIPLEDLIQQYMPNFQKLIQEVPGLESGITLPSGHIVALPGMNETGSIGHLYIHKKWMDNLGISEPETLDDLYELLKAFKEDDPNGNGKTDEIPMSFTSVGELKPLLSSWGLLFNEANLFVDDNGAVIFSPMQPQFKEAMKYFNILFSEGLLDNESFTQNGQQLNAKGTGEEEILGSFYTAGGFLIVGEERHFNYTTMIPLKSSDGQQIWPGVAPFTRGTFAITSKCQYPEAMARWIDYLYSEEGGILTWAGVEGEDYTWVESEKWDWNLEEGQEQNDLRLPNTIQGSVAHPSFMPEDFWHKLADKAEASLWPLRSRAHPYDRLAYPMVYFSEDRQKEINTLNADIGAYVDQMIARFVTGDASIDDEWDNYISTLENMNVEKLVKIYQDTYDELNE